MNSLKWTNSIAFLLMIAVNVLANVIPIGGNTTGEVSYIYPNLLTPAPITFSIWAIIYLLMLLFVVFQFGFVGKTFTAIVVRDSIGWWFVVSCVLNISWIFAWHMRLIELSTLLIVSLLVNLVIITKKLYVSPTSLLNYVMVKLGFDIYLGWIIVAAIVNINVLLVSLNWNRFGLSEVAWTLIVLFVGALIGALVVFCDGRYFAGLSIIWAYVGIVIRHVSASGYGGQYRIIIATAMICICIIMVTCIFRLIYPKSKVGVCSTID